MTKGLAEYRIGRFASAEEWIRKALRCPGNFVRDAEAYLVLAMTEHGLQQAEAGRAALDKGAEIVEMSLPEHASGVLGDGWVDWVFARALMHQANPLVAGPQVDNQLSSSGMSELTDSRL